MMDMVRKHCVPGTGNYEAAQACVDRTHEMLRMFKEATRNFVSRCDFLTELLTQHLLVPVAAQRVPMLRMLLFRLHPATALTASLSARPPLPCTLGTLQQITFMVKLQLNTAR